MSDVGLSRRRFLQVAGAGAALAGLATSGIAYADPQWADAAWIANHIDARLMGADGQPVVGLPKWTRMRVLRGYPNGLIQVWVPRFNLVGRVAANTIGPVPTPSPADLAAEQEDGPPLMAGGVGLPGRVAGGAN